MIYKWKTWVQDITPDLEVLESLDEDITEICQKGGWEVWQMDYVNFILDGEPVTQRVITFRSKVKDRAEWWDKLQELSNEVQHDFDGSGDETGGDQAYLASLEAFYLNAKRELGLK